MYVCVRGAMTAGDTCRSTSATGNRRTTDDCQ